MSLNKIRAGKGARLIKKFSQLPFSVIFVSFGGGVAVQRSDEMICEY